MRGSLVVLVVMFAVIASVGCSRSSPPPAGAEPAGAAPAVPTSIIPLATTDRAPAGDVRALHLALGDGEGAAVSVPSGCTRVEGHTFSSSAEVLRLHLNVARCPASACPSSLVDYLDSPAARDSRRGGEVLALRAIDEQHAILWVRNPVLDLVAVVATDIERRVVVSCSAQTSQDREVAQAVVARCLDMTLPTIRAAAAGEDSRATFALECR